MWGEDFNLLHFLYIILQGLTDVTQYYWDFGDGDNVTGMGLPESGVQTHMYEEIGVYTVKVVASNDHGTNSMSLKIKVGSEHKAYLHNTYNMLQSINCPSISVSRIPLL